MNSFPASLALIFQWMILAIIFMRVHRTLPQLLSQVRNRWFSNLSSYSLFPDFLRIYAFFLVVTTALKLVWIMFWQEICLENLHLQLPFLPSSFLLRPLISTHLTFLSGPLQFQTCLKFHREKLHDLHQQPIGS